MDWDIDFISYEDFKKHVRNTIAHYGEKLEPYDVEKFNSNIIDPVKMILIRLFMAKIGQPLFRMRFSASAISQTQTKSDIFISACLSLSRIVMYRLMDRKVDGMLFTMSLTAMCWMMETPFTKSMLR